MTGYVRLELRRFARMPGFLFFTTVMPAVSYLVFTSVNSITGQTKAIAALYAMVSMASYGAIGAMLNYGTSVVTDRQLGWLRQLRLSPMAPLSAVGGKLVSGLMLAIPSIAVTCLAAVVVNGVHLSATQWLEMLPLVWFGAAPFLLFGLGIGYVTSSQTAQAAAMGSYMGMSILGGLWVPLEALPDVVQHIGRLMPTYAYVQLPREVAFGGGVATVGDGVTLAVWVVAFTAFAVYGDRRAARRAS